MKEQAVTDRNAKGTPKVKYRDPVDWGRIWVKKFGKEMTVQPTEYQLSRGKIGRNDICLCGSGLKFKKCCGK